MNIKLVSGFAALGFLLGNVFAQDQTYYCAWDGDPGSNCWEVPDKDNTIQDCIDAGKKLYTTWQYDAATGDGICSGSPVGGEVVTYYCAWDGDPGSNCWEVPDKDNTIQDCIDAGKDLYTTWQYDAVNEDGVCSGSPVDPNDIGSGGGTGGGDTGGGDTKYYCAWNNNPDGECWDLPNKEGQTAEDCIAAGFDVYTTQTSIQDEDDPDVWYGVCSGSPVDPDDIIGGSGNGGGGTGTCPAKIADDGTGTMCLWASGDCWPIGDNRANCAANGWIFVGGTQGAGTLCAGGTFTCTGKDLNPPATAGTPVGCCNWNGNGCFAIFSQQDKDDCTSGGFDFYDSCANDEAGTCPTTNPVIDYSGYSVANLTVLAQSGNLHISSAKDAKVSLFNISGKQVFSKNISAGYETVSLKNQKQGVYFAVVQSGSQKQTIKVVLK